MVPAEGICPRSLYFEESFTIKTTTAAARAPKTPIIETIKTIQPVPRLPSSYMEPSIASSCSSSTEPSPEGTFNTDVSGEGSVEEEQEEAMDGSIYDDGSLGTGWIVFIVSIIGVLGALAAAVVVFIVKLSSKYKDRGHIPSAGTIKRRNKDQETNVPPAIDDYAGIAFMLMHMNMGYFEDIFQACLMKWTD